MKKLLCALTLVVSPAFANDDPFSGWADQMDPSGQSDQATVGGYRIGLDNSMSVLLCSPSSEFLSVQVAYMSGAPADFAAETVFIRLGEADFTFDWTVFNENRDVGSVALAFSPADTRQSDRWDGQEAFITALRSGADMQVMVATLPDRSDAREVFRYVGEPDAQTFVDLDRTCGAAASAPEVSPEPAIAWVTEFDPGEDGGPESLGGYWEGDAGNRLSLGCSDQSQALSARLDFYGTIPVDPSLETVFLRVNALDYLLPWAVEQSATSLRYAFGQPSAGQSTRWPGQDDLLSALLDGAPIDVMVARAADRSDARILFQTSPEPGAEVFALLNRTCGSATIAAPAPAPEAPPAPTASGAWSVVPSASMSPRPTALATTTDTVGRTVILGVTCDGSGSPLMRAEVSGDAPSPGTYPMTVDVDGERFAMTWSGSGRFVQSAPTPELLSAMQRGQRATFIVDPQVSASFSLRGSRVALDQALARCFSSLPAPRADGDAALVALKADLRAEVEALCAASGASGAVLEEGAFQETLHMSTPLPDVVLDFSFVSCTGGAGPGAGQCNATGCLHKRYLSGETGYFLNDEYRQ